MGNKTKYRKTHTKSMPVFANGFSVAPLPNKVCPTVCELNVLVRKVCTVHPMIALNKSSLIWKYCTNSHC